jgi:hypothetical protein
MFARTRISAAVRRLTDAGRGLCDDQPVMHLRLSRTARLLVVALGAAAVARADVYQVGPTRPYTQLQQVLDAVALQPGDVVEVDGAHTYAPVNWDEGGDPGNPVTLRGRRVNGQRPVLSGGTNTIEISANHVVFEAFEVTGGSFRCVYHHADDITVRDVYIHDCPAHGLLGADTDSGSLTLEFSEVARSGNGTGQHAIYVTSDQDAYPGSVFRMRFNYVHDQNGGNAVKSRAERNEIHYNWIEGARFHLLELIGPDEGAVIPPPGIREDSDVVGNVLIHKAYMPAVGAAIDGLFYFARPGSDMRADDGGANSSRGRYRFVNNTFVRTASGVGSAVFRMFGLVESIEMSNNVFFNSAAGAPRLFRATAGEFAWASGTAQVAGQNNWVETGAIDFPPGWTGTITGTDPGFRNLATGNLRPVAHSPLRDAGTSTPTGPAGFPLPSPLFPPASQPASRAAGPPLTGQTRLIIGPIDIGAYEHEQYRRRRLPRD